MTIKLVSFDLDGTLVDTAGEIAVAVNRTLADFERGPHPQAAIEQLIGAGAHELMRRLLRQIDVGGALDATQVLARFDQHYADTAGTFGQAYPGCCEALQSLRDDGVQLACVTNKEMRHAGHVLAVNQLTDYFELVIGGDSLPCKKPDASVLRHVLATFDSTPGQAAHVGDSETDIAAARNAGVAAWAVPWGYNSGRPVAAAAPDRLFQSMAEIAQLVRMLRATPAWSS
ncbi:MAG: phosphoglycolate phosphatase [Rhodanobacter sp.]|nr:MAG: phosphoglycolate phosphatase [Rhodanobacter sp.]TAM38752.1 MAG: phosphoglycolate phosphatase [Rhodanobacter sp.]